MNTIVYILLILAAITAGLSPLIKKAFDQLSMNISNSQFELLRKLVGESVAYVNQLALVSEMSSEEKKTLAITTAQTLAGNFGIPKTKQMSISDLIESILWTEEEPSIEDSDDFDD